METQQLFEYDKEIRTLHPIFCGLDEAGRGPLAGDVYAAAVVFDDGVCIEGLNDSKKLTEKKRELLFDEIINKAKVFCIATASVEEIEELNILNAAMLAMKRAYEGLDIKPDYALADGNKFPPLGIAMYPEYQFARHKGYGTKLHYEMLDKYGPSPVHRMSFLKKYYAAKQK